MGAKKPGGENSSVVPKASPTARPIKQPRNRSWFCIPFTLLQLSDLGYVEIYVIVSFEGYHRAPARQEEGKSQAHRKIFTAVKPTGSGK
jgi:hypothetical protein